MVLNMSLWLQILSYQLPAGPRRRQGPACLVSFIFFLSLPSPSPPFSFSFVLICLFLFLSFYFYLIHSVSLFISFSLSIFLSFHLSSTYFPLDLVLQFPALFFPSFLSFSLSLVLCKRNFHVTLIGNTTLSHNVTRIPGCRNKLVLNVYLQRERISYLRYL